MTTTLIVIWLHLANAKVGWFSEKYPTHAACELAKKRVRSETTKTWRFCK